MNRHIADILIQIADKGTQLAYRLSGGRLGEKQLKYSMLLLHTTGRKTGELRTHALLYIRDGANLIVCASNYGAPRHPAWYLNLQANPYARVQAGRVRQEVIAETAGPQERERLWQMLLSVRPQFASYQAVTSREIPIVILKPLPAFSPEKEQLHKEAPSVA